MMKPPFRTCPAGFTLVEIMVAVAIGLATVLVATQVLVKSTEQKRASISGNDSMVNATLALYTIERDVKNAGFGLTALRSAIGCTVISRFNGAAQPNMNLVPIFIADGTDGAADTIQVMASAKRNFPLPIRLSDNHPPESAVFFVDSDLGVEDGDIMIAAPGQGSSVTDCVLFEATAPPTSGNSNNNPSQGAGTNRVNHAPRNNSWNWAGGNAANPFAGRTYGTEDYLLNLGTFIHRTYSTDGRALWLRRRMLPNNAPDDNQEIYPHIVQLQAAYGSDTDADGDVDVWSAASPANWQQVIAVRVALVARSNTREAAEVTPAGNACAAAAAVCWRPNPNAAPVDIAMNINNANPNWRRYRYRVLETTIPLRNTIWFQ